jgi:hypothetical protein
MLSSGANVIIWDENVIIWDQMLSSGTNDGAPDDNIAS